MNEVSKLNDLGDYEFSCGNYSAAYEYFKSSIEVDPTGGYAWYRRSLSAEKLGNYEEFSTGIARAKSFADKDLLCAIRISEIEAQSTLCAEIIKLRVDQCGSAGYGPHSEVTKDQCEKKIVQAAVDLFDLRFELRHALTEGEVTARAALDLATKILSKIEAVAILKPAIFGDFGRFWVSDLYTKIAPRYNNFCAWVNFLAQAHPELKIPRYGGIEAKFV